MICGIFGTPRSALPAALFFFTRPNTLVVDARALTETLKSSVDVPDEETRRQWEKEAAEAADAAAAPVLSRAFRLRARGLAIVAASGIQSTRVCRI